LPTRDSDSMDWLNNTLGTSLGALMYRPVFVQRIVAKFGIVSKQNSRTVVVADNAVLTRQ
jgi:hypothetical protein